MSEKNRFHQLGIDSYYKLWHAGGKNMILYFYNGTGSVVTEEKSYPINKGFLCFVGAYKFHYTLPDEPEIYERSKVFLSNELLQKLLNLFPKEMRANEIFHPNSLVYAKISQSEQATVEALFKDIERNSKDELCSESVLLSCYMRFLIFVYTNISVNTPKPHGALQNAMEYINLHIAEKLTLDDVCSIVHMSKYHFCRKFKQATGLTVMDYVFKTRIMSAQNMLRNTQYSIEEISERCGFGSISYFCRVFKKEENCSPLQYRKRNCT